MYLHLLQMIWGGNTKLVNSNWRKWRKMRRRIKVFTVIAFLFWAKFLVFTVIRSILSLYWFPSHHSSECLFVFQWISLVKADCIVPWSLLRRCWWPHTDCFSHCSLARGCCPSLQPYFTDFLPDKKSLIYTPSRSE